MTLFKAVFYFYMDSYLGHVVKEDLDNLVQTGNIRVVYLVNTLTISLTENLFFVVLVRGTTWPNVCGHMSITFICARRALVRGSTGTG